jgi:uncharacterized protein YxeA
MNLFSNKKITIFILSAALIILISVLFFPNLFSNKTTPTSRESAEVTEIKTQSKDTSLESIKNDLDKTNVDGVDKELESIEKEINTAI